MSDNAHVRVQKLQQAINETKAEKERATGQLQHHMSVLKEKFGVSTTKAAQKLLQDLETKHANLTTELEAGLTKLESEYEW